MRSRSLILEAGAGTGKTTAIVGEALSLLLADRRLDPARVALITFTDKAAGEIAERIRGAIVDLIDQQSPSAAWPRGSVEPLIRLTSDEDIDLLRQRREQLDQIRSQTIHSFCQTILRLHPIEAGLDTEFSIIQGFELDVFREDVYKRWLENELEESSEEVADQWRAALDFYGKFDSIRNAVVALANRRDVIADPLLSLESGGEAFRKLRELIARISSSGAKSIAPFAAFVRATPPPATADLTEWNAWSESARASLEQSKGSSGVTEDLRLLKKMLTESDRNIFQQESITLTIRDLTLRFLRFFDSEKRLRGIVDFDDLLLRTRDLLRDRYAIRAEVRERYDVIVVDEFQDTDPIQSEIVRMLTTSDDGSPIPGKLIVVGDPKQSIYSFRRADPENYGSILDQLEREGAEKRELQKQFRSDSTMLQHANVLMSKLFARPAVSGVFQPSYQPLEATRESIWRGDDHLRMIFLPPAKAGVKRKARERARDEARAIARWIVEDRNRNGTRWSEYALLFSKMTHVERFFDRFDAEGVPFVLGGGRPLLEERAAVELLATLRAIATEIDQPAEISAARSSFFALTDDEIALHLKGGGNANYRRYLDQIAAYRAIAAQMPIHKLIDRILDDSQYEATQRLLRSPERSLDAVHRLRDLAAEYDVAVAGSLSVFVDEMIHRKEAEASTSTVPESEGDEDAVRIMTVHASKGLEFGTVILPSFDSRGRSDRRLVAVRESQRIVVTQKPSTLASKMETLGGVPLSVVASERDERERDRLFYVAMTRAKHRVVILADVESQVDGFWKQWSYILGRKPGDFASLVPAAPRVGQFIVDGVEVPIVLETAAEDESAQRTAMRVEDERVKEWVENRPISNSLEYEPVVVPAIDKGEAFRSRLRGKQRAAGILLHRFLELWDFQDESIAGTLDLASEEIGVPRSARTKVERRIEVIRKSEDLARLRRETILAREMPVVIRDENGLAAERRIDLVTESNGRLRVIDYKSGAPDMFRDKSDKAQVRAYCEVLQEMTGQPCDGTLWYLDVDSSSAVDVHRGM
jgi:ATP-dependent helicase/nuclease subunit A